jgi:hypothetical protein
MRALFERAPSPKSLFTGRNSIRVQQSLPSFINWVSAATEPFASCDLHSKASAHLSIATRTQITGARKKSAPQRHLLGATVSLCLLPGGTAKIRSFSLTILRRTLFLKFTAPKRSIGRLGRRTLAVVTGLHCFDTQWKVNRLVKVTPEGRDKTTPLCYQALSRSRIATASAGTRSGIRNTTSPMKASRWW